VLSATGNADWSNPAFRSATTFSPRLIEIAGPRTRAHQTQLALFYVGLIGPMSYRELVNSRFIHITLSPVNGTHITRRPRTLNPAVSWLPEPSSSSSSSPTNIMSDSVLPGISGYDPHNLQPWTVAVVVSVTVLATVAVAIRLFSRHLKAQKLWWDDYMIIFSQVCRPR
jgi:hypothetical protein